jgi:lipopolysaccharide export system protein LptA
MTGFRRVIFFTVALVLGLSFSVLRGEQTPSSDRAEPPKTRITGERMNLLRKGEAVEFVGSVKMVRGTDFLSADRMVSDEKKGLVQAWGNVYLRREVPEENLRWEAWGEEGAYNNEVGSGTLMGKKKQTRVRRTYVTPRTDEGRFEMEADRITFFRSTSTRLSSEDTSAVARGNVYAVFEDTGPPKRLTQVWAGHAVYHGSEGRAQFWKGYESKRFGKISDLTETERVFFAAAEGMPWARQTEEKETRNLSGKTLAYFVQDERLTVEENVRALLLTNEAPKKRE